MQMGITITFLVFFSYLLAPVSLLYADNINRYIEIKALMDTDTSSECAQRGGLRFYISNTHPSKIIDIHLDRFFDNVRQPGRSMFALQSGHKQALGCNMVMDSQQHWKLIDAKFISLEQAEERYGSVY